MHAEKDDVRVCSDIRESTRSLSASVMLDDDVCVLLCCQSCGGSQRKQPADRLSPSSSLPAIHKVVKS